MSCIIDYHCQRLSLYSQRAQVPEQNKGKGSCREGNLDEKKVAFRFSQLDSMELNDGYLWPQIKWIGNSRLGLELRSVFTYSIFLSRL